MKFDSNSRAGNPISGKISLQLPEGDCRIRSTPQFQASIRSPGEQKGEGTIELFLDPFEHDLVLRAIGAS